MTHLDFRLGLVRGLLGMPVARFGKRARGRKRKAGSSSSSSSSLPIVLSTPERKKARDEAAKKGYSSTKKGSKISGKHQYPRQRASKAGKGLEKSRLENPELKTHRAFPLEEEEPGERVRHRCQVCSALGKQWKDKDGMPASAYRGRVKEPRVAEIMCVSDYCPTNYCSIACFNLWHYGQEYYCGKSAVEEEHRPEEEGAGAGGRTVGTYFQGTITNINMS